MTQIIRETVYNATNFVTVIEIRPSCELCDCFPYKCSKYFPKLERVVVRLEDVFAKTMPRRWEIQDF